MVLMGLVILWRGWRETLISDYCLVATTENGLQQWQQVCMCVCLCPLIFFFSVFFFLKGLFLGKRTLFGNCIWFQTCTFWVSCSLIFVLWFYLGDEVGSHEILGILLGILVFFLVIWFIHVWWLLTVVLLLFFAFFFFPVNSGRVSNFLFLVFGFSWDGRFMLQFVGRGRMTTTMMVLSHHFPPFSSLFFLCFWPFSFLCFFLQ